MSINMEFNLMITIEDVEFIGCYLEKRNSQLFSCVLLREKMFGKCGQDVGYRGWVSRKFYKVKWSSLGSV
jgi:hypothetical protein